MKPNWYPGQPMFWKGRTEVARLLRAVSEDDETRVRELLAAGEDPNPRDATGLTPLMSAAYLGHDNVLNMLIAHGAAIDARDDRGYTALMFACNAGKLVAVESLVRAGADVNARDRDGSTPLMFAAQHGHDYLVGALLKSGADSEQVGNHGLSAIGFAEQNQLVSTLRILRSGHPSEKNQPDGSSVSEELRSASLTTPAEEFGIVPPATSDGVWSVIMDTTFDSGGSYTTVALVDGNASIYIGEQSGIIGGVGHRPVRDAAKAAVVLAAEVAPSFRPGVPQSLPTPGRVRFSLRSAKGLLVSPEVEEKHLGAGQHSLSSLFFAMHEVISQLRLTAGDAK